MKLEIPEAFADLFTPKRYKIYHGGRGGAKSESFARALLAQAMSERMGVLCAREIQKSIKDSVHRLLREIILDTPEFNSFYTVTETEIKGRNASFFIFMGLKHNIQEIKSLKGIKRCWVEEAQAVSHNSWEILIPTIREDGSEIWISFNEKNPTDPTYSRFVLDKDEDMFVKKVSWRDNPYFPSVLEKERIKLQKKDPDAYAHVWEGEFDTRYSGSVYAKFLKQDQIKSVPYDPSAPIYTAWDLGYDDATSVVFYQIIHNEIHIIDYYENNFQDIQHYCEVLYGASIIIDERSNETGKVLHWHFGERLDEIRAGYDYTGGVHYVPHDADYKLQAAAGRSIVEQASEFGVRLNVIQATNQQSSEQALRKTLPHCWFNQDTTRDLVHAMMNYHYDYDEECKIYSKVPVHDWSSHAADSLELMARMWQADKRDMKQIKIDIHDAKFHQLRQTSGLHEADPYRVNPRVKR